ncbi:nuclear transport factor 2 family protein [Oceanospirillum sediminis]|uniref:Nuclear transport factor 2 family protein n=1 Tax=Oceanospirillum sediminis TaxID=2760088 RepID=A0A839INW3_9GAMM|nr:nuclear transport factor 2 family protein [Oceanospirillum sediminis]MBB1486157.1 nuclear transport factor 2 family protein [Oceanospirillum sediminis]
MSTHKELIETFYTAFQNRDYKTMASCYHPDAYFRDEAFELRGNAPGAMWHMLCERAQGMTLEFSVTESGNKVTAHWEPKYCFSQTGRPVHNIIDAEFEFQDGKIIRHIDHFNFWRWSRQALGLPGLLLGWSPFLRRKVSKMAMKSLNKFMEKHY